MKRFSLIVTLVVTACSGSPAATTTATTLAPTTTATTTTSTPVATTTTVPEYAHRIDTRVVDGRGEFFDTETGATFVVRGVNLVFEQNQEGRWAAAPLDAFDYDPDKIRQDFANISAAGFTTVRMFLDHCGDPPGCITVEGVAGLDPSYLDHMVDLMDAAAEHDLFLLLTSNDIPDWGGYGALANSGANEIFAGYRNAHYLTAEGHEAARRYWSDLIEGLAARGARFDRVLGWSLLNEQWLFGDQPPLSLDTGVVTTADGDSYDLSDPAAHREMVISNLTRYIGIVREAILEHDPTALVTMGFFAPQFPHDTEIGGTWYVDTAGLIDAGAPLDFYDFHAYPGEDITLEQIAENFGVHLIPEIPVVLGEYGAFIHRYPRITAGMRAVMSWQVKSCSLGFDGWVYWAYRTNPEAGDATWGLISDDGALLDLLAPAQHPDPCAPVEIPTDNIAFGADVVASRSIAGEPPEHAVDDTFTTQWGAGAGPPQWIELRWDEPQTVSGIHLTVAQFPEGRTRHRVLVAGTGEQLQVIQVFDGITADGDVLAVTFDEPLTGVVRMRIETTSSPSWVSWREIEVFG